ncbi:secreted sialidase [Tritrichomonas foetus]|uniref:Secreted sialidase n=1 Tax=Tritrichomonas foetus TaxID=1144522 RepID=A0A1J4J7L8_9EUKA|nr:secreted sialidase [Tritrichomonas foetus]|eukprot:OHS95222.1 secreted sialidase [Tritrichomonas foetus]
MLFHLFSLILSAIEEPTITMIHTTGMDGSKYYRIPAIAKAKNGTIICACDKRGDSNADLAQPIQIVIRKSYDDGFTFDSPLIIAGTGKDYGYSDPSLLIDEKTGAVLCVFNAGNRFQSSTPTNQIRNVYCISYDNGETWSDPIDFTPQIYGSQCTDVFRKTWNAAFVVSGSGIQTRDGKLMFMIVARVPNIGGYPIHTLWTEDLGRTWHVGAQSCALGDETKVVQLDNNSLLASVRNRPRKFVISNNLGESWEHEVLRPEMIDPGCNGDIHRYTSVRDGYDKSRLIHTNQYHSSSRRNLTIKISYDEGNTWKYTKSLYLELSAYSAVEIANDGSILIYFEKETTGAIYEMALMRVSLEYITDGEDKYTPPSKTAKEL